MTSKHPKRCETCKHYQTRFEYGNKKICTLIKERAPGSYQIGIPFHIDIVGCCSHSSANEPVTVPEYTGRHPHYILVEKARKQERAEVLDEANLIFIRVVDDIAENGDANWHKCDMLDKMQSVWCEVESLRQQEGKP